MKRLSVSPKVYVPLFVNLVVGLILIAIDERELGVGILLAAVSGAGLGYASPHERNPK